MSNIGSVVLVEQEPQHRSVGSRIAKWLLVGLLVLAATAVGVDRYILASTQRSLIQSVVQAGDPGTVTGVDVQIHGFPFLTQVFAGRLTELSGTMETGAFGGLAVQDVHLLATGVHPDEPFFAEHAEADALIPYATIETMLASQVQGMVSNVSLAPDPGRAGALAVSGSAFGIDLGLDAAPVVVPPAGIRIDVNEVTLSGISVDVDAIPFGIGSQLHNLNFNLDLPPGVALNSIEVEDEGLRIYAGANDVALESLFEQ